tara:strand:- start:1636 stop:1818 length:183 start_codon:yes stop_codon:yes gene_type:complete
MSDGDFVRDNSCFHVYTLTGFNNLSTIILKLNRSESLMGNLSFLREKSANPCDGGGDGAI